MCNICDGQTFEESRRWFELTVLQHGWALQGIHPAADDPYGGHWTYTIGLLENFNHPEVVITDTDYEIACQRLNAIGEVIRANGDVAAFVDEHDYELREIHADHLGSELLYTWHDLYGHVPAAGQVLQLVPPDGNYCPCHAHLRTDLRDPNQFPGSQRPNRAQRRALNRGRRRR